MASVTHSKVSTAPAASDPDIVDGPDWNAAHVLDLAAITGTPGGAAAAGGSIAITGGTGDSGNDAGASITVGGGSGAGDAGAITVVGIITAPTGEDIRIDAPTDVSAGARIQAGAGNSGEGGAFLLRSGAGGTGAPGGSANFQSGGGDDGTTEGAVLTLIGGDTSVHGYIELTTGNLTFQVLGGTADPSAGGGVAANVASLYARDNSSVGELWVKTGATDTAWTKVV